MDDQPTVSINGVSHAVLCGLCNAPVAFGTEADGQPGNIGCAACGNWDAPDQVAKAVFQQVKDEGQLALNRLARDAAAKSKFMTFSGKTENDQTYRFIIGEAQG